MAQMAGLIPGPLSLSLSSKDYGTGFSFWKAAVLTYLPTSNKVLMSQDSIEWCIANAVSCCRRGNFLWKSIMTGLAGRAYATVQNGARK